MFDMREILMPSVMNNFKLAEPLRLKQRPFLLAMGIAIVLAMGVLLLFVHRPSPIHTVQ